MNLLRVFVKSDLRIFSLVFTAIMLVAVIQVVRQPLWYKARATLKHHRAMMLGAREAGPPEEDWNGLRVALKSSELIHRVIGRLSEAERTGLIAPYAGPSKQVETVNVESLIGENQGISYDGLQGELTIEYRHPDRLVAAQVVNLLMDEVIVYQTRKRIDEAMKAVEELKLRAEAQEIRVRELTDEMTAYRVRIEKTTGAPFESNKDYEALLQKQASEKKLLDRLIQKMRDMTMVDTMEPREWSPIEIAMPPNQGDYLIAPILRPLARGFVFSCFGGLLAVGVMNILRRDRERADNQKEAA